MREGKREKSQREREKREEPERDREEREKRAIERDREKREEPEREREEKERERERNLLSVEIGKGEFLYKISSDSNLSVFETLHDVNDEMQSLFQRKTNKCNKQTTDA